MCSVEVVSQLFGQDLETWFYKCGTARGHLAIRESRLKRGRQEALIDFSMCGTEAIMTILLRKDAFLMLLFSVHNQQHYSGQPM